MMKCPRCGRIFTPQADSAPMGVFEYFHVLRDAYAEAQGYDKIYAKHELCVRHGIAVPYNSFRYLKMPECPPQIVMDKTDFEPPKWPGVFCQLWGQWYYRKSTLVYTKTEFVPLIEGTISDIIELGIEIPTRNAL